MGEEKPNKGEVFRLYTSWYLYIAFGLLMAYYMPEPLPEGRMFTVEQLAEFDGEKKPLRYLAVLGQVFDVSNGVYYEKDSEYHFFVGKDASRGFSTGKLRETDNDLVSDMNDAQIADVTGWLEFYESHAEYKYVGKVIGRYYDEKGHPSKELKTIQKALERHVKQSKEVEQFDAKFPSCNSRWSKQGSSLWCTDAMLDKMANTRPGMKLVPRKIIVPMTKAQRCACVDLEEAKKDLKKYEVYKGCASDAVRCEFDPDDAAEKK